LGDSGGGWTSLRRDAPLEWARWSFPDAPEQAVSCNGGNHMPSWFDIEELPLGERETVGAPRGIVAAVSAVHAMLRQSESLGFPAHRTILGGFSQGAALALLAGLSYEKPLAGIIALSGWAIQSGEMPKAVLHRDVPLFLGHGEGDTTVPCSLGRAAELALKEAGCNKVYLHTYASMGHSACPQELRDVHRFLEAQLPEKLSRAAGVPRPPPPTSEAPPLGAAARSRVVVGKREEVAKKAVRPSCKVVEEDDQLRITVVLTGVLDLVEIQVDLASQQLKLKAAGNDLYELELQLPHLVNPELASTKFSRRRQELDIIAPKC
ncbi:unnamed protein product, partial [Polarella glacialis]